MHRAIAAYEETLHWLGEIVSGMALDVASLCRPLQRCRLSDCGGNCCYDGAYLGEGEAEVIREVVKTSREGFEQLGVVLPERAVVFGSWRDTLSGPKTATRPEAMKARIAEYPAHFPETACVFLMSDARCALQALARERSLPPWFYKPVTCWLHPLTIEGTETGNPVLTLHSEADDPQRFEDYDGFVSRTHCGRTCEGGAPAFQVLAEELTFLGGLGGRDLIAEIEAEAGTELATE